MGLPVPSRWGILCRQAVEGENKPVSGIGCGEFFLGGLAGNAYGSGVYPGRCRGG